MNEIWKPVVDYEGWYEVSSFGRVRRTTPGKSTYSGRILANWSKYDGYLCIELRKNNKGRQFVVHRLVAEAFIGSCPEGKEANHKDGNKHNNIPENLEYVTPSENQYHAYKLGLKRGLKGEANPAVKLTRSQIEQIRLLYSIGLYSHRGLAKTFGMSKSQIGRIIRLESWRE